MKMEYFEDLVDLTVSTEERLLFNELGKDAADCPYIHTQTILPLPQKYLWRSIPQSLNLMRECLDRQAKSAGKSKICNFQYP